jgi:transposase InsO family protein
MEKSAAQLWAEFRFSVVGQLLAAPPTAQGDLKAQIEALAKKTWQHPTKGEPKRFAASTIEAWLYKARRAQDGDVVKALARQRRSDAGSTVISPVVADVLVSQYRGHRHWTAKLHADNLVAALTSRPGKLSCPSYPTVRRFLKARGLDRVKRRRSSDRAGAKAAQDRLDTRETRAYEAEHVGGLWHLDMHHARRQIVLADGRWVTPIMLAVIDDHSRLICHAQWYLSESTQDLVHGFNQALMRRGLPRSLMTDNGKAMVSAEFTAGLTRLGILHEPTLFYSPHQNGKVEKWWGRTEGRLMAMLDGVKKLDLGLLNNATMAWVEREYHREEHSETKQSPLDRFLSGPSVMRPAPNLDTLHNVFRRDETRTQRRGDGTVTIDGIRFEVPARLRHLRKLTVRYAEWDLAYVHIVDPQTGTLMARIMPLDKGKNADGRRCFIGAIPIDEAAQSEDGEIAPLLRQLMEEDEASGLPKPYLPTIEPTK